MQIEPVAIFRSPFPEKFGIPRQSGVAAGLRGRIVLEPAFRDPSALRGLGDFDYIWLIWEFSGNKPVTASRDKTAVWQPTVRPPRLGGNTRMGVFATRSPFRPNPLGLSCVRLERIEWDSPEGPVIHVLGADLMDGTPIFDIKPYIRYADSHPEAHSGFTDTVAWQPLKVVFPWESSGISSSDSPYSAETAISDKAQEDPAAMATVFSSEDLEVLRDILAQDPRPPFHDDPDKIYGMSYAGYNVRFQVRDDILTVLEILPV